MTFGRGTALSDGRLDLCKQSIGPLGVKALLGALEGRGEIQDLLLGTDGIGDEGAAALAEFVDRQDSLRTIYLGCNGIGPEGVEALVGAVGRSSRARGLWLKRNPLGVEGARHVAGMLAGGRHRLEALDLVNTGLGDEGVCEVVEALGADDAIKHLFLGGNGAGVQSARALASLLRRTRRLETLTLSVNGLGDEGAAILGEAAGGCGTLRVLSLASNGVGPQGAARFVAAMGDRGSLGSLDLGCAPSTRALGGQPNRIGDVGAEAIAGWLRRDRSLRALDVHQNGVTSRGAWAIKEALAEDNRTLERVVLGKGVARKIRRTLQGYLARNRREWQGEAAAPEFWSRIQSVTRALPPRDGGDRR